MPEFRRGAEAMAKATEKKSGGDFRPFTPEIFWSKDGDERFLLFLNPISEIPTVEMINFIPREGKKANGDKFTYYERTIARTAPEIGEDSDPMVEEWQGKPKDTCVAVAVELEPTFEEVKGRKRPTGFAVKTKTFDRRIRDEEGELTDESEEVEAPEIGFVHQSPHNFFNVLTSYDANDAPIEDTPLKITRVGSGNDTTYTVNGYPDQTVDLTDLLELIENVSYLGEDADDILAAVDEQPDDQAAALTLGNLLLDKRLDELADGDRYDELFEGITSTLDKFGGKGKDKKGGDKKRASRRERPARASQRRSRSADPEPEAEADPEPEEAPEPEAEVEEKPKPARTRRTRTAKPKDEAPADDAPEEATPRGRQTDSESKRKLAALRDRAKKATANA